MKRKIDIRIPIIILLAIILIIMCYFYFRESSTQTNNAQFDTSKTTSNTETNSSNSKTNAKTTTTTTSTTTTISSTNEVSSALTENLELHATYYLEESYIQTNQLVKAGENILKYTNGTYLTAPYDCVITEINIPDEEAKCTNEHYVKISSNNNLMVQFKVDETKMNAISLGQEASIQISAYEDKTLEGVVTNISSTASNGKFTVTVEFENDSEVMLGMTAIVTIK